MNGEEYTLLRFLGANFFDTKVSADYTVTTDATFTLTSDSMASKANP